MSALAGSVGGSLAGVVLQSGITGGGPVAILVTFLLVSLFYAVTLHLAATFFIGDVESQRAAYVAPVPAVVSILLGQYGIEGVGIISPGLAAAVSFVLILVADAMAISRVYDLAPKPTAALTALHVAFAAVLGFALNNLIGFV
jgi:hypothetical protein